MTNRSLGRYGAAVATIALVAACSPSDVDWSSASYGRDVDGSLHLIGAPCSSVDLTAISIVEAANQEAVLRIELDDPTAAWDVVVGLDPLIVRVPGSEVVELDEAILAEAVSSSDDRFEIISEIRSRTDGSERVEITPFRPGLLAGDTATDFETVIEEPAEVRCPRGGSTPWGDVFER